MEDVSIIGLDIAKTTFQAHGATVDGGQRGKGKRGGGRAIYVLMVSEDLAIMIMAYTKNEQSDRLCCTKRLKAGLPLIPDRPILRPS